MVIQLVLSHHGIVKHMVNLSFGVTEEGDIAISLFLIKFWKDDTYCPLVFSNHGSLKNTMRCLQFINYLHFRPDDDLFTIWDFVVVVVVVVLLFLFCFFACVWVLLFFCFIFIRGTKRCSVRVWRKGRTHHKLFVSLYPNKQDVKTKLTSALCRTGPINPR